jgi:hypothetical protein
MKHYNTALWGSHSWLQPAFGRPAAPRRLKGGCSQKWLPHGGA